MGGRIYPQTTPRRGSSFSSERIVRSITPKSPAAIRPVSAEGGASVGATSLEGAQRTGAREHRPKGRRRSTERTSIPNVKEPRSELLPGSMTATGTADHDDRK